MFLNLSTQGPRLFLFLLLLGSCGWIVDDLLAFVFQEQEKSSVVCTSYARQRQSCFPRGEHKRLFMMKGSSARSARTTQILSTIHPSRSTFILQILAYYFCSSKQVKKFLNKKKRYDDFYPFRAASVVLAALIALFCCCILDTTSSVCSSIFSSYTIQLPQIFGKRTRNFPTLDSSKKIADSRDSSFFERGEIGIHQYDLFHAGHVRYCLWISWF